MNNRIESNSTENRTVNILNIKYLRNVTFFILIAKKMHKKELIEHNRTKKKLTEHTREQNRIK